MTLLVHWLWQGSAVAMAACLALRLAPRTNGATRYALLWMALGTVIVLPLAWPEATLLRREATAATGALGGVVVPDVPGWIAGVIGGGWLGWVILSIVRLGGGWWRVRWLCRTARPLPRHLRGEVRRGLPRLGGHRRPVVRVSSQVRGACAVGFRRPTILVSASLVDALDVAALRQIVLHEHAHLERHDHWGRLVESLTGALVGLHPAIAYLLRRLDLEREVACDEHVVWQTRAVREYARALVDAAGAEAAGHAARLPAVAPGAARSRGALRVRVERLLGHSVDASIAMRRPALVAGALGAALVIGLAATTTPLLVFADVLLEGPRAALAPIAVRLVPSWQGFRPMPPEGLPAAASGTARATSVPRPAAVPVVPPMPGAIVLPGEDAPPPVTMSAELVIEGRTLPAGPPVLLQARPGGPEEVVLANPWEGVEGAGRTMGRAAARAGKAIGAAGAIGGSSVGRGARRAGTSLAAFFTRTH